VIRPDSPHCAAAVPIGMTTGPGSCASPVTNFILVLYPMGLPGTRCAFLCAGHARSVPLVAHPHPAAQPAHLRRRSRHSLHKPRSHEGGGRVASTSMEVDARSLRFSGVFPDSCLR